MAQLVIIAVAAAIETASFIYRLLNRPTLKPPVGDLQIASALDGAPRPFGYGRVRIAGCLIWTPGLYFTKAGIPGTGSLFTPDQQQYLYFANFAFAFCEGPAAIRRLWADEKLIYDAAPFLSEYPAEDYPPWQSGYLYNIGDIVSYQGLVYTCEQQTNSVAPGTPATSTGGINYWTRLGSYAPFDINGSYGPGDVVSYDGQLYVCIQSTHAPAHTPTFDHYWRPLSQYYPTPTIYPGSQTQMPDPDIQANEGVENTPAFRGTCYAKFLAFPLANFGNRIPSIRAELDFSASAPGLTIVDTAFAQVLAPSAPFIGIGPVLGTDFLIAAARFNQDDTPSNQIDIFDCDASGNPLGGPTNTWTPLYSDHDIGVWYCDAPVPRDNGLHVRFVYQGELFAYNADAYLVQIRGVASWNSAVASGLPPGGSVTLGDKTIAIDTSPYGPLTHWAAVLITFTGADGSTLSIAALFNENPSRLPAPWGSPPLNSTAPYDLGIGWEFVTTAVPSWSTLVKFFTAGDGPSNRLARVVSNVCKRAGLDSSMIDVSLLTADNVFPDDIVQGYAITRPTAAAEIIKTLFRAFFFDACESDGALKFVPRGLPAALTIPEEDLGLLEESAKVNPEMIGQSQDLPREITLYYNDIAKAYQQGKQLKQRTSRIVKTRQKETIELALTMDASRARQISEKALYLAWLEKNGFVFSLWRSKYMRLDPTDVIKFVYQGNTIQLRGIEILLGLGFATKVTGARDDPNNYQSSAQGASGSGFIPQPLPMAGATLLFLFDIPLVRDSDSSPGNSGYYAAMSSELVDWISASLFRSTDNSLFGLVDSSANPATFGYAQDALGSPRSPWTWDDTSSVTIKLTIGTLVSNTDINVLNGVNFALLGDPATGKFELFQFANSIKNADGTYTLSRLLRGRRGTEVNVAGHAADELFVLLPDGVRHETASLSTLGQLAYYDAVATGETLDPADSQPFTNTGNDLRPYAPVHIAGARDASGNLTLTWIRRTRIGGAWLDGGGTVPLSEDRELYDVEILNGSNVVRTFSDLTSPTVGYTAADQSADFGSLPSSFPVRVFQKGTIGRGFAGIATV